MIEYIIGVLAIAPVVYVAIMLEIELEIFRSVVVDPLRYCLWRRRYWQAQRKLWKGTQ